MSTPEGAAAADEGGTWTKLLRGSAIASVLIVVLINVLGGELIPPLLVFSLIWIAGIAWLTRATKPPAIFFLISFVAFLALSAPFVIPTLGVPATGGEFVLNVGSLLAAVTGIVAAIAVLRGLGPSGAVRSIVLGVSGVFAVATIGSVIATVAYDDAVLREGDVEVVTEDIEFRQTSIEAEAGEVSVFVRNEDATLHTFTIDDLDVDLAIPAGKAARVTFEAEAGEYEFYCVPHKDDMEGSLTVR